MIARRTVSLTPTLTDYTPVKAVIHILNLFSLQGELFGQVNTNVEFSDR